METTAHAFEEKFGQYLSRMRWLNLGGGHHITRADYDIPRLVRVVKHFREKYGLEVYLEPGEAVVLNAGFLVSTVPVSYTHLRERAASPRGSSMSPLSNTAMSSKSLSW